MPILGENITILLSAEEKVKKVLFICYILLTDSSTTNRIPVLTLFISYFKINLQNSYAYNLSIKQKADYYTFIQTFLAKLNLLRLCMLGNKNTADNILKYFVFFFFFQENMPWHF